ncbi:MAG: LexA family protein [Janthinobacterium lividum]
MQIIECSIDSICKVPFFSTRIQGSLPSSTDNILFNKIDLNNKLIQNPLTTFFVKIASESMIDAGINKDDLLIVDKNLVPIHNNIVIAVVNNEFTVKKLKFNDTGTYLTAENLITPAIKIDENSCYVCGVVTSIIR